MGEMIDVAAREFRKEFLAKFIITYYGLRGLGEIPGIVLTRKDLYHKISFEYSLIKLKALTVGITVLHFWDSDPRYMVTSQQLIRGDESKP